MRNEALREALEQMTTREEQLRRAILRWLDDCNPESFAEVMLIERVKAAVVVKRRQRMTYCVYAIKEVRHRRWWPEYKVGEYRYLWVAKLVMRMHVWLLPNVGEAWIERDNA